MKLNVENFSDMSLKPDHITVLEFCECKGINVAEALDMSLHDINALLVNNGYDEISKNDIKEYISYCETALVNLTDSNASYEKRNQHIDSISIIQNICCSYSTNIVADVLANNVISKEQYDEMQLNPTEKNKIIDEKYLPKVKRWAINKVHSEDFDYSLMPEPI